MSMAISILNNMAEPQSDAVIRFAGILADPLARRIMAMLAASNGHVAAYDACAKFPDNYKVEVLSRLGRLERCGVVVTVRVKVGDMIYKTYRITDPGKGFVEKHMGHEYREFL